MDLNEGNESGSGGKQGEFGLGGEGELKLKGDEFRPKK